jgi:hypothetical protein
MSMQLMAYSRRPIIEPETERKLRVKLFCQVDVRLNSMNGSTVKDMLRQYFLYLNDDRMNVGAWLFQIIPE